MVRAKVPNTNLGQNGFSERSKKDVNVIRRMTFAGVRNRIPIGRREMALRRGFRTQKCQGQSGGCPLEAVQGSGVGLSMKPEKFYKIVKNLWETTKICANDARNKGINQKFYHSEIQWAEPLDDGKYLCFFPNNFLVLTFSQNAGLAHRSSLEKSLPLENPLIALSVLFSILYLSQINNN